MQPETLVMLKATLKWLAAWLVLSAVCSLVVGAMFRGGRYPGDDQ